MLINESLWFKKELKKLSTNDLSPVLNLGSSDLNFRVKKQPWVNKNIIEPLFKRGIKVINLDKDNLDGVDIVCDLESDNFVDEIKKKYKSIQSVFIFNLLEHLKDREVFCKRLMKMLSKGSLLFISCPYKYPYHPDPIDTMYRPKPSDIMKMFPKTKIVSQEIIKDYTFLKYLSLNKILLLLFPARLIFPFYKPNKCFSAFKHIPWLNKNFYVSCLILKKY